MSNSEQLNELMSYCNYQWVKYHGARGGLFTGENGNSIFLPAAGIKRYESQEEKLCDFYWLSEICNFDNQVAYTIELSQNGVKHEIQGRSYGLIIWSVHKGSYESRKVRDGQ